MTLPPNREEPGARQLRRETEAALSTIQALRRAERTSRLGWFVTTILFLGFASVPLLSKMGFILPGVFDLSRLTAEPLTTFLQSSFVLLCCIGTGMGIRQASVPFDVRCRELEVRFKRELREGHRRWESSRD